MPTSLDFLAPLEVPVSPSRRRPAWLLPVALLAGFAGLLLVLYRDRLLPAESVRVARVVVTELDAPAAVGTITAPAAPVLLFQASGWIEPEPYAVKATALIDGVVDKIHVLEGQPVEQGALIATLVDDDAKLRVRAVESRLRVLQAERASQVAAVTAAESRRDSAVAAVAAAQTLVDEAVDQQDRLERLRDGAVPESDVISARLRVEREKANLLAVRAGLAEQEAEITRLQALILTKDEEITLAGVAVSQEQLALERTRILAPVDGRVLRLLAAPGEKKMLGMDHPDSSTIAVLYDPARLQVRVDVPLAEAAKLRVGQRTVIHCSVLPHESFEGEVMRIMGEADLQRNTLQAKVTLRHPSGVLRPEMLCRVEFFATAAMDDGEAATPSSVTAADSDPHGGSLALWVPVEAIRDHIVWVVDGTGDRVRRREVSTTTETRDGFQRISSGLLAGERVVVSPPALREGQRVRALPHQP